MTHASSVSNSGGESFADGESSTATVCFATSLYKVFSFFKSLITM